MSVRQRLAAAAATVAALAIAAPVATAASTLPIGPQLTQPGATSTGDVCFKGFLDIGPFGPYGPYGPSGPYGPNGPLAGHPNPIGDAATCGGFITYILRGGTLNSFVQGNIASVGIQPPTGPGPRR